MIGLTGARSRVRDRLIARATGGAPVDLSTLDAVPRRLLRPLRRTGLDPVAKFGRRTPEPVHRLAHMFGMNIWLVSGHAEAKTVLADRPASATTSGPTSAPPAPASGDWGSPTRPSTPGCGGC